MAFRLCAFHILRAILAVAVFQGAPAAGLEEKKNMTDNKQALPGHETQSEEMNGRPGGAEVNLRLGAISIRWLVVVLVVLVALVLVLNRMAQQPEIPAGQPDDMAKSSEITVAKPTSAVKISETPIVKLADIDDSRIGSSVAISGQVVGLFPPPADSKRPYALKVADDSGEKTINFWQMEYDQIPKKESLDGAFIRARVSVASYQGKLQLKLASGLDLEVLDAPPAAVAPLKTPAQQAAESYQKEQPAAPRDFSRGRLSEPLSIASISGAQDGQTVKVRGRVVSVRAPAAGTKQPFSLVLRDGAATLRATYWSSADDVIAVKPAVGALFEIEGVVEVYQDKPQLKVESGYKVVQVEAAPAATAVAPAAPAAEAPAPVAISAIAAADKGQIRAAQGTLGAPRALGKGTAYALTDGSGTIDLILWDSIIPAEVRAALREGLQVSAVGVVGEYDGKLQLKANPGISVRAIP
jgi:DNA/RNA endonuclease YhcR with UshA esterase domain